ncbi:MAG: hypothetical protein ACPGEG_02090 [Salibacteraceae bacterium]
MRLLVLVSLILSGLGCLVSCSSGKPMPEHNVVYYVDTISPIKHEYRRSNRVGSYQTELTYAGNTYNGKLFIKKINRKHFKLAYTTDSDFKLFAIDITDTTMVWDYCFEKLDRKIVKKIFERNFRALLALVPEKNDILTSREDKPHTILGGPKENVYIYWTDDKKDNIYKTLYTNGKEVLVIVHYLTYDENFPTRIKIADHASQMTMTLVNTE